MRLETVDWAHLVKRMQILVLVLSYFFSLPQSLVLDRPKIHRTWLENGRKINTETREKRKCSRSLTTIVRSP